MFEADSEAAYRWLIWSRLFCLPFAFVGIWVASCWAWQLYGRAAGLGAAILWAFFPNFIGYGCLIGGDMQAASIGLASFYLFRSWLARPGLASTYLLAWGRKGASEWLRQAGTLVFAMSMARGGSHVDLVD